MRPAVHATTERIYDALGDGLIAKDEATGWQLLYFLDDIVAASLGAVDDIARDSDDGPGWLKQLDPDLVPAAQMWWLAQFVGVRNPGGLSLADARIYVKARPGWERGTKAAMMAEVRATLDGDRRIAFNERSGSAYQLSVQTHPDDTPDPDAAEAALRRQKPAGIVLAYDAAADAPVDTLGGTVDDLVGNVDDIGPVWEFA